MKNILYIGRYNGIVGGIERYMQKSAELLRRHGYEVHYRYTENAGFDPECFSAAFDSVAAFSPEDCRIADADTLIVHNIIPVDVLNTLPVKKTFFFAHDHNIYCRRHHYYTPVGRRNCHRKYHPLICKICSLGRNVAPPLEAYRKFPALVLSDFVAENLKKNGFETVVKLPAFIQTAEPQTQFMPDGVLRILFLGQLIRGKGADLMLKTLAKLDIPFSCTIAGNGKDRIMLEKLVEKFNLRDKVRFAGFVSDPEDLWKNSDVFFFPIRWQEPFGLVCPEAMAHGVPVVAFDLGGVREYLSSDSGVLIPEKSLSDAAAALKQLAADPERLKKLGKNGYSIVKNKFSEERFMEIFQTLPEVLQ